MRPAIYGADWVLPVASPPIRDGAVLVDGDGRIAAVGPRASIDGPPDAERVELGEAALLPGLINVHGHPELAVFRGAMEDLPFREWILRLVGAKRSQLRDEDYMAAARWTAVEAIRAGMTTIGATEASGAAVQALTEAGLRGVVYLEVFGPDPRMADRSIEGLRGALAPLRDLGSARVRVGVSPHAPYTVSDALFTATAEFATAEGLPIAVHIGESQPERLLVTSGTGDFAPGLRARGIDTPVRAASPVRLLERLGVLDADPLLIHCVDLDEEDIAIVAEKGCAVAHCPIANAKLGHGAAPLPALLDAGIRVGLGTDSVGSNNRLDLLEEARFAALLQRAVHRSHAFGSPEALLRLVTVDGARALGWADRIGTLEPGKAADLCAVSLAGPHVRPVHDPVAALFHSARASDVLLTAVDGRILYRDDEVQTIDEREAARRIEVAAARLREGR